jgi:hypothetical protein
MEWESDLRRCDQNERLIAGSVGGGGAVATGAAGGFGFGFVPVPGFG